MNRLRLGLGALACLLLVGCHTGMHFISGPGDRVIRASSGERFYLTLEEPGATRWTASSDDRDVEVSVKHLGDGTSRTEMRVIRGFDGPAQISFHRRGAAGGVQPAEDFTIIFYKRTGDVAFWE